MKNNIKCVNTYWPHQILLPLLILTLSGCGGGTSDPSDSNSLQGIWTSSCIMPGDGTSIKNFQTFSEDKYVFERKVYSDEDCSILDEVSANPFKISKLKFHSISQILHQATEILKEETLLLELNVDDSETEIFVIGDIHGNLKSLQRLIEIIEQVNPKFIVFLGDIVDRGPYQLECLILILALKIKQTNKYIFLKGNHESLEINQYYGFYQDFIHRFSSIRRSSFLRSGE